MDENQKRTPGGRSENRRSNNRRREGGNAQAANRGSNAQPKFDPHFVSAPEATPLRPAKKKGAVEPAPIPTAANNARPERGERNEGRSRRGRGNDRAESRDNRESRSARPAQQKFTSFEEYMNAHGGATAPIEDHSEET